MSDAHTAGLAEPSASSGTPARRSAGNDLECRGALVLQLINSPGVRRRELGCSPALGFGAHCPRAGSCRTDRCGDVECRHCRGDVRERAHHRKSPSQHPTQDRDDRASGDRWPSCGGANRAAHPLSGADERLGGAHGRVVPSVSPMCSEREARARAVPEAADC